MNNNNDWREWQEAERYRELDRNPAQKEQPDFDEVFQSFFYGVMTEEEMAADQRFKELTEVENAIR